MNINAAYKIAPELGPSELQRAKPLFVTREGK